MKEFTEEELAQYDGKNGNLAYVSYKGKVYNVTGSFLWKEGTHQVFHRAGVDLTDALEQAPHGGEVLDKFPVVGILQDIHMPDMPSKP
ncbi:MAG: cytochrome B5 [Candidatus Bathyarchaeota archaeon]|nr:cytochrome B5 [Candidatus Bathyarchaeota archaeon]MDH5495313.1 cytochrome B5 [Candidatus Bathyarchaeota archaeon]